MSANSTYLFLDWFHVARGNWGATLDPTRLSEQAGQTMERDRREYGARYDLSGHGMRRSRLPYGIRITPERAGRSEPWLVADRPWEHLMYWVTVLRDEGRYRCWYSVMLPPAEVEAFRAQLEPGYQKEHGNVALCYAESEDGVHWRKPALGLWEFQGSRDNNIVSPYTHESAVMRDDSAPVEERYKAFVWTRDDTSSHALGGAVSADGYRWRPLPQPVIRGFYDTQNVPYWDPIVKKYVGYFRCWMRSADGSGQTGRAIGRSETDDFGNWPAAQVILCNDAADDPSDDFYTNGFTPYPDDPELRLMFSAVYNHFSDEINVRLAVSRDGRLFNWVSRDPIVPVGVAGEWDCGRIYPGPGLLHLPDGRLAMPYKGHNTTKQEWPFTTFYRESPESIPGYARYAWATWDDGRLAGIEATSQGEFWTNPASFDGARIEINARTRRMGRVEIELWDSTTCLDGFSFAENVAFTGDEVWAPCQWRGKRDLSELKGKKVSLHVRLSGAKMFGYRFA